MSIRALVILAPGCEELEAIATADTLVRGGIKVTTASIDPHKSKEIVASRGMRLVADHLLEEVAPDPFDIIVLPGGMPGATHLRDNPMVIELLKRQQTLHRWRAAICASPAVVLASHGLIESGAQITGYPGTFEQLDAAALNGIQVFTNQPAVTDSKHRLITSQGPATAIEFGLAIIAALVDDATAQQVRKGMLA